MASLIQQLSSRKRGSCTWTHRVWRKRRQK